MLTVDAHPPELTVGELRATLRTNTPLLRVTASDPVKAPRVTVRVDGEAMLRRSARHPLKLRLDNLTDGEHTITVVAVDTGRNVATNEQTVLVDTTEKLGDATLTAGARGKDVRELQRKLRKAGFLHHKPTGVLDAATLKAVKRFETHMGMEADGVVGPRVVGALSGRIVVDLSECRLYLYKDGKLVKTYSVAVGQPGLSDADRRLLHRVDDHEPHLDPARLALGKRARADPARSRQPRAARAGSAPARREWASTARPPTTRSAPTPRTAASACTCGTSRTCSPRSPWACPSTSSRSGSARPRPSRALHGSGASPQTPLQATHALADRLKRAQRSRLPQAPSLQKTERQ